jgi:8-oxo-dGTP diphosphatase
VLLLRHASAGDRLASPAADRVRPLDRAGRADARKLVDALGLHAIDRIVTSPHRRCVDTVRPLARARDLDLEVREELAPDAALVDTLALLATLPDAALVCAHREVVERLFAGRVSCEKGGLWVLERRARSFVPTEYLAPPARTRVVRPRRAVVV